MIFGILFALAMKYDRFDGDGYLAMSIAILVELGMEVGMLASIFGGK